jgi:hypothetical protein
MRAKKSPLAMNGCLQYYIYKCIYKAAGKDPDGICLG